MLQHNLPLPSNKKFGLFFSFVFFLLTAYFVNSGFSSLFYVFGFLSILFLLLALIRPLLLKPLNHFWMSFGLLLGKIVNPIVMGVIFFGLFTPLSLFFKFVGRDVLKLKVKKEYSYWLNRDFTNDPHNNFKDQF